MNKIAVNNRNISATATSSAVLPWSSKIQIIVAAQPHAAAAVLRASWKNDR